MNKHAQNLRAMLALLPVEVCHTYRDKINEAADEIDRLENAVLGNNHNPAPAYEKPLLPPLTMRKITLDL